MNIFDPSNRLWKKLIKRIRTLRWQGQQTPQSQDYLDTVLLQLSAQDVFTIRHAVEGVFCTGGIGAGKTSGPGKALAKAFLEVGCFGGLVLTSKTTETDLWRKYARKFGREQDLIVFSPGNQWRFNFLDYEMTRSGSGAGLTRNIVELFTVAAKAGEPPDSGGQNDTYWKENMQRLIENCIDLLKFAGRSVSLPDIYEIILSAPKNLEVAGNRQWQADSFCYQVLVEGWKRRQSGKMSTSNEQDYDLTRKFFMEDFPDLDDKPRSTIISVFTGMASRFLKGEMRELFCTTTNFTPEDAFKGKIIVLDIPEKEYHSVGVTAQIIFKYLFQRAVEQRDIRRYPLPVCLWVDESQTFITEYDYKFQATAREKLCATVYLTQNISNYYAALGGESRAKSFVDSFIGNMTTKIFLANSDAVTNKLAAEIFAQDYVTHQTQNFSFDKENKGQLSIGENEQFDYIVKPIEFTRLKKGGPPDFVVEGIVHQGGKVFQHSGTNALRTYFSQK